MSGTAGTGSLASTFIARRILSLFSCPSSCPVDQETFQARLYFSRIPDFAFGITYNWSAEEAARQLSVPVAHIRQRLKLAQLIPEFFDMLKKGKLRVSMALRISSLPKQNQKELLKEEKLTLEKIEKGCRSFKLDTLLGEDDLFDVPEIERDALEEAKAKIFSVIETSESDTTLLREAIMLIDRYRAKEGGK
jgi:hypothetical protein